jgi:hypothetical protein
MVVRKRVKPKQSNHHGKTPFWLQEGATQRGPMIEEKAMMIFQPDILIDAQFQASHRRRFHLEPERVLMLAVLQDAVGCFQEHVTAKCKRKQVMHHEAEEWISNQDRSYPFSFDNICDALGFDANYMRQGLARWKRAAKEGRAENGSHARLGSVGT